MNTNDGGHWSIQHLQERVREDGDNRVPPNKGGNIGEKGLDDVGQHGVVGGDEEDSLTSQQGTDDLENVVHTQTHERIVEPNVQVPI